MFNGEFLHTIDPKGRIIIPAAFRRELGEKFTITKGLEGCLFVFSETRWKELTDKLGTLPLSNSNARAFARFFFSTALECELDKNYRILIPAPLRDHAGLEKDISIIGVGTRVEVWDRQRWESYTDSDILSPDSIAETMGMLGI